MREGDAHPETSLGNLRIGRRALLSGTGAVIAASSIPGSADAAEFQFMRAHQAEDLADSFGVVVHLNFDSSVYGHQRAVVDRMIGLGARHARTRLVPGLPQVRQAMRALATHGCQINATCQLFGDKTQPSNQALMRDVVRHLGSDARSVFSAFEGMNEPNNSGAPWVHVTRTSTIDLWRAAKSHRATHDVPIVGPALADTSTLRRDYERLGDLTAYTDMGNIHLYPRGTTPSVLIDEHSRFARATFGDQRIVCTEGGYNNALHQHFGHPVPEDVAGIYGPRHLLEHFIRGNRFFRYELLDDVDPSKKRWEANYGLVRVGGNGDPSTWRGKPAFKAMRNMLDVVGDRGRSFTPHGLDLNIRGGGRELRAVLLQKRTGGHYLCLWRDVAIYDPVARRYLDIGKRRVDISLKRTASVKVFEPSRQRTGTREMASVRAFAVHLGGGLQIVRIR